MYRVFPECRGIWVYSIDAGDLIAQAGGLRETLSRQPNTLPGYFAGQRTMIT